MIYNLPQKWFRTRRQNNRNSLKIKSGLIQLRCQKLKGNSTQKINTLDLFQFRKWFYLSLNSKNSF